MLSMAACGQAVSLASWSAPRDLLFGQSAVCDLESLATSWPKSVTRDCDLLGLPPDFPGGLIKSQAEECGVPQAVFRRPFYETDLRHELRLRPVHLAHLIRRDAPAPSPDISVRKIGKWAVLNLQRFQLAENLAANVWDEARSHLSGEAYLFALVVSDQ